MSKNGQEARRDLLFDIILWRSVVDRIFWCYKIAKFFLTRFKLWNSVLEMLNFQNIDSDFASCRSFSLSRSKKINRKPFSGLSQEIVILLKIDKEDSSPSFRSVRSPKPQIFVEMFRKNLQSSVWKRHVGAHLRAE